jgi:hypothetical protein
MKKVPAKKVPAKKILTAYFAGEQAKQEGKPSNAPPKLGPDEKRAWLNGWSSYDRSGMDKINPNKGGLTTPLTEQDLLDQREQIQNDLICILEGIDQKILDNVCQVIVDRFKILINKRNSK